MSALRIAASQKVRITANLVNGAGSLVPGTISWSSSNTNTATVEPLDDGKSAYIVANAAGLATITATGTPTGGGQLQGVGTYDIQVVADAALFIVPEYGDIEAK